MTDYRKTPKEFPWATQLDAGDILSKEQAANVNQYRLGQYGLCLSGRKRGGVEVRKIRPSEWCAGLGPWWSSQLREAL